MRIRSPYRLRHLEGAMDFVPPDGAGGSCIYRSAALVIDLQGAELCIGILQGATKEAHLADPRRSPTPFIHCWVERGDDLIEPADLELHDYELVTYDRDHYYKAKSVRYVRRLLRKQVRRLAAENGWSRHLLTGEAPSGEPIMTTLLAEAGVAYEIGPRRSFVPPGTITPSYAVAGWVGRLRSPGHLRAPEGD